MFLIYLHLDVNDVQRSKQSTILPGTGLDLEFETDVKSISPDASQYETIYVTSHKGPCRAGVFHPRGMKKQQWHLVNFLHMKYDSNRVNSRCDNDIIF